MTISLHTKKDEISLKPENLLEIHHLKTYYPVKGAFLSGLSEMSRPLTISLLKLRLPNILSTIIVQATITFATMIVAETGLSFLGFGVPQDIPSWGNMLNSATEPDVLQFKLWIWVPPALIITITILSINFIGEGLKDAFNPKSKR